MSSDFSAQAVAIGQSIIVQIAVKHGLGTHQRSVSDSDFVSYSKVWKFIDAIASN
jgi:hypothetical protein